MKRVELRTTYLLENESLQRRHHQSNVLLMSRTWIKYLGFVTGMILALIGAVFVLGKLEERPSSLSGKTTNAEFALTTASPGIIMAVLGTILMLSTIFTNHKIEVIDVPVYTNNAGGASSSSETAKPQLPTPASLDQDETDSINQ